MTDEASPRPWRAKRSPIGSNTWIVSGETFVASVSSASDAALIVAAVNERAKFEEARMEFPDLRPVIIAAGQRDAAIAERDRLRDIVRRLADVTHSLLGNYEYRFRDDQNSMEWVKNVRELTREARAALWEDAK